MPRNGLKDKPFKKFLELTRSLIWKEEDFKIYVIELLRIYIHKDSKVYTLEVFTI